MIKPMRRKLALHLGLVICFLFTGNLSRASCPTSGVTDATKSALNLPLGEATDAAGNLYISDTGNNRIEMITPTGNISTIAGKTEIAGSTGDGGPALSAEISAPSTIAVDGAGNIFFADTGNSAIREINAITQKISTVAGTLGTSGSTGNALAGPQGFAFDATGNLYIADTGNNSAVSAGDSYDVAAHHAIFAACV